MDHFLDVIRVMADKNRIKMIEMMLKEDLCVGALAARLDISQAAVSQHLLKMRKVGLVTGEKRGYFTHYTVHRELILHVADRLYALGKSKPTDKKCPNEQNPDRHCAKKSADASKRT